MRSLLVAAFALVVSACATRGGDFKSDTATLSQLVVGKTTPEEAAEILDSPPMTRQNLPNGTIAWTWSRIVATGFGVTDHRQLVLQFTSRDGGRTWQFYRVINAINVDLPPGMPFGSTTRM